MLQDLHRGSCLPVKDINSPMIASPNDDTTRFAKYHLLRQFSFWTFCREGAPPCATIQLMGIKAVEDIIDHNFISGAINSC
jgi:hypothetical protein